MDAIHNARIVLFTNLLNTMAGSSFVIGVLTPVAAVFFYSAAPAGCVSPRLLFLLRSGLLQQ
jgi:VIT1/CCC1 family predicted Fe2+/Mn2+ transporter